MTRLLSLLCLLTLVGSALAQPTLRIGGNTRVVGSGAVRLVYGGGSLTNNGSLSLTTGQFAVNGSTTYGGTGAATVADLRFSHSTGNSTLNSLLSVTNRATLTANTALNANGQLYLRTDLFPSADMVNDGVLTGTVQGLVTKATLTTGAAPYNSQLSVNLNGSAMRYQWQSSPNNSQWTDVPNATGSTYTANVTVSTYYRCRLRTTNSSYDQTTPPALLAYTGPDLTLLLYARPTLVYGPSPLTVVVDVVEINSVPTSGSFTVRLTKDQMLKLSFDASLNSMNGRAVQNNAWRFSDSDPNYYVLTTSQPIAAGGKLSLGLSGSLLPGASTGMLTVTATVLPDTLVEGRMNNNTDADKVEYFQQ